MTEKAERLDQVDKPLTTMPTEVWRAAIARAERAEQERDEERKHYELAMQLNDDYLARAEWAEAQVRRLTECLGGNCNKSDKRGRRRLCRCCWNRIDIAGLEGNDNE